MSEAEPGFTPEPYTVAERFYDWNTRELVTRVVMDGEVAEFRLSVPEHRAIVDGFNRWKEQNQNE
jgi:hypothetical protein